MTTDEIAQILKLTAQLMELHNDNPFKIKSIANAAFKLNKMNLDVSGKTLQEIESIEGVGKGIAAKIEEIAQTGELKELNVLIEKTPVGVIEMLSIKGIGPKKVRQLWQELEIESVGELLYACNENRLIALKGFGEKTQKQVKEQIDFFQSNIGKCHYASVEKYANGLVEELKKKNKTELIALVGQMRRKCEIIDKIEILIANKGELTSIDLENNFGIKVEIISCSESDFYYKLFSLTSSDEFSGSIGSIESKRYNSEEEIFKELKIQFVEPELREQKRIIDLAKQNKIPQLIEYADLKGCLHNHSSYSDGINTLKEMALKCKEMGLEYFGICDHSQAAVYANGLKEEKVMQQHQEIEKLNNELAPFKIFKGIESDILNDGSLDYPESVLKSFDFIVASVHSNLKMDKTKATQRVIKAVENPYTTILGHASGRLLLSRKGYELDYEKVIDACAQNNVIIELNANPYRLDIDWRWIPYCIEKGVKISINPDAHELSGFYDMYYGIQVARKGMLTKEMCFNALSLNEMENYFNKRK